MDKPISRGKFNVGYGLLLVLLLIGLLFFSAYFFRSSFPLQIDRLIAAVSFTALFIYFLARGAAAYKAVDIYRSHVKLKWIWGSRKIYPSDISRFSVTPAKICLRKEGKDILLSTRFMNNDAELIEQLVRWNVKRRDSIRINDDNLVNILMKVIAGVVCIAVFYSSCMKYRDPISYDSLVKIQGHLSRPPRTDNDINLSLAEYPSISFQIAAVSTKNYQRGTAATLWITKDAYQRKILQRRYNWSRIETYEAELNGDKILELSKYNKQNDEMAASNKKWALPLIVIFILIFFALRFQPTK